MDIKKLNFCVTAFTDTTDREKCLSDAELISTDGSDNGNLNVCFGDEIRVPFGSDGAQPAANFYSLRLSSAEYDKRVYAPGTMKLTFTIGKKGTPAVDGKSVTPDEAIIKSFGGLPASLFGFNSEKTESESDSGETITYSDVTYILKDYLLQFVGGIDDTESSCILTWRSPDFELTLERGCEVFESKKFGSDIFGKKAEGIRCDCDVERLMMMGYDSSTNVRDGYHTETQDVNGKEEKVEVTGHDAELIHPYLVRYNESVYDFLVRVAYRCGEWLYYEYDDDGGVFCLGLPENTVKHILEGKGYQTPESIHPPLCSYKDLGGGKDGDSTGFATNYLYAMDSVTAEGTYYDIQHTSNDFLYRISDSDDPSQYSALDANVEITMLLAPIFTGDGIIAGLMAAITMLLMDILNTYAFWKNMLHNQFEGYKEESEGVTTEFQNGLDNSFFHTVEINERKAGRHTVNMDFSDRIPTLRIGDDIDVSDGLYAGYVISRVYGIFSSDTSTVTGESTTSESTKALTIEANNYAEAVPVLETGGLNTLPRMSFPPAADIPRCIRTSAMEAIVARTDDPLYLGRVKVRYPWQYNEDGEPDNSRDTPKTSEIPLSPWIRVLTPYAGTDIKTGIYLPLSVGEHVMLNYVDGNIERPYVAGSLYFRHGKGGETGTPESHGPEKGSFDDLDATFYQTNFNVRSLLSSKGHGLMFKDTPDTSAITAVFPPLGILLDAIKKLAHSDTDATLGGFKGGGLTLADGSGTLSVELDADKRNIGFSCQLGRIGLSAFTGITISAPNGDVEIEGKNVFIEAGNNLTLRSGANIRTKSRKDASYIGQVIGSVLGGAASHIVSETTNIDLTGCLDLSFLRCIMEIVLRPVEGTLRVRSGRNIVTTAGSGKVTVPVDLLVGGNNKYDSDDFSKDINDDILTAIRLVDEFFQEGADQFSGIEAKINKFRSSLMGDGVNLNDLEVDYEKYANARGSYRQDIINSFCSPDQPAQFAEKAEEVYGNHAVPDNTSRNHLIYQAAYKNAKKAYEELVSAAQKYKKDILKLGLLDKKFKKLEDYQVKKDNFRGDWTKIPDTSEWEVWKNNSNELKAPLEQLRKQMQRDAVLQVIFGSKKLRLLKVSDTDSKLISAESDDVKDAGGTLKWDYAYTTKHSYFDKYIKPEEGFLWADLVSSIADAKEADDDDEKNWKWGTFGKSLGGGALAGLGGGAEYDADEDEWTKLSQLKKLRNKDGSAGPRAFSHISTSEGGIMFSNTSDTTLKVAANASKWESYENGGYSKNVREKLNNTNL